jgi:hypothetical protein
VLVNFVNFQIISVFPVKMDESWGEDEDGDDLLLASAVDGAAIAVGGRLATGNN